MTTSCPARAAAIPPSTPRQDITTAFGGEPAFENLVPADERATVRGKERIHLAREVALQLVLVLEAELLDPRLRERTGLPLRLRGLIAADMDPAPGEQGHHLGEHVLLEPDRCVAGIDDVFIHAPRRPHRHS